MLPAWAVAFWLVTAESKSTVVAMMVDREMVFMVKTLKNAKSLPRGTDALAGLKKCSNEVVDPGGSGAKRRGTACAALWSGLRLAGVHPKTLELRMLG